MGWRDFAGPFIRCALPEAGPTTVVPGSRARRRPPDLGEIGSTATVPIECKAASIAVWDGRIWHDNAPRTIDGERAVLHVSYTRLMMRQIEVYPRSVQDRLVERYGEPMAQLMARYDFLAKPEGKAYVDGFMRAVRLLAPVGVVDRVPLAGEHHDGNVQSDVPRDSAECPGAIG